MEKKPTRPMTPFDEWTVPNELHTLKLLLPYTPAASQPALGMLVKVIELQHTMEYFQNRRQDIKSQEFSRNFSSPLDMLEEIAPYLPPEQANMIDTFRNMMNIMEMVQMMQTFTDSGGTSPSTESDSSDSAASSTESGSFGSAASSAKSGESGEPKGFGMPGGFAGGFNPMSLVMGMLSPEQQEMFEMYQAMFSDHSAPAGQDEGAPDISAFETQEENVSDSSTLTAQEDSFSDSSAFTAQEDNVPDDFAFGAQNDNNQKNFAFETQENSISNNFAFGAQEDNSPDNFAFEAQEDGVSDEFGKEQIKERTDSNYE